jgi:hypothetical protein
MRLNSGSERRIVRSAQHAGCLSSLLGRPKVESTTVRSKAAS